MLSFFTSSMMLSGDAVSAVGKKSNVAFWRQIHLAKYLASPLGLGKSVKSNTKVTEGRKKNIQPSSRPGVDTVSKHLSD